MKSFEEGLTAVETSSNLTDDENYDVMEELGFGKYDFRGDNLDSDDAYQLGLAYSNFYDDGNIVIGRDHREDSKEIKDALVEGFNEGGHEVIDAGLVPTDVVAYLTDTEDAIGGAAVTASHMPIGYHGIKSFTEEGRIHDKQELNKVAYKFSGIDETKSEYKNSQSLKSGKYLDKYLSDVESRFDELFEEDLSGLKVSFDPGNGLGIVTIPKILQNAGVKQEDLYIVNGELDPEFSGRGPNTENELPQLSKNILENDTDIGIATDGDADRIVYMNEEGERVSGDEALGILAEKYLPNEQEGQMKKIAVSGNTSQLVEDWIDENNGLTEYLPVGAVFPAKKSLVSDNVVLGGQPNGHVIDPSFVHYDSASLFGAVMPGILQEKEKELSELQDELPEYEFIRKDFECDNKEKAVETLRKLADVSDDLEADNIYRKNIERSVGDYEINDNFIFRPSGSEDVVRLTWEREKIDGILESVMSGLEDRL